MFISPSFGFSVWKVLLIILFDFNAIWNVNLMLVSLLQFHRYDALRNGNCAFCVVQPTHVRLETDAAEAWRKRRNSQYSLKAPWHRSRCPSMAQAMAQSLVAESAEVCVYVGAARNGHFIQTSWLVLQPFQIKVLPETGGAHVKHSAPVASYQLQCGNVWQTLDDVAAHVCA